jgi:transposase
MNRNHTHVYVGLDYHSSSVQVCAVDAGGRVLLNTSVASDAGRVGAVLASAGLEPARVAIEVCTGSQVFAEQLADRFGWEVRLTHAGQASRMKASPDKSDHADARILADLCRTGFLPPVWAAPAPVRELRRLTGHRMSLVRERRQIKCRVGSVLKEERVSGPFGVNRWTLAWLSWLGSAPLSAAGRFVVEGELARLAFVDEQIDRAENELRRVTADNPLVRCLREFDGIGEVTSWLLAAEVARFDRFTRGKQLSRFCGLSPRNASSGRRQADAGLVRLASPELKGVLIQATHALVKKSRRWQALCDTLIRRGKPKPVAIAAVANRWVRWLHAEVNRRVPPEAYGWTRPNEHAGRPAA